MDTVNLFNAELSSLYDVKPPISKGKMTAITKAALRAVKLYKHVVQSVEKFIQKCKPEYKIPGLYVIDSIIRQSRHQFGIDKDIFAGRFARNLQATFVHLYKCPDEDKSKVIRVLNLWQKNRIFLPEAIQPLFDLADPNNPIWDTPQVQQQLGNQDAYSGNDMSSHLNSGHSSQSNDQYPVHFKKELLDYDYDEEDEGGGGEGSSGGMHPVPPPSQLSQVQSTITTQNELTQSALSGFDALGSILTNPEVLRQLQTLQEQMAAAAQQQHNQLGYLTPEQERQRKLAELNKQEAAFDQRLAQTVAQTRLPFTMDCELPFSENKKSDKSDSSMGMGVPPPVPNVDQNSNHQQNPGLLLPPPFFHHLNAEQLQQMLPSTSNHSDQQQHINMMGNPPPSIPNPFGIPLNFPLQTAPSMHYQQQQSQQNPGQFNSQQLQQLRDVGNAIGFPVNFKPDQPPPFEHANFNEGEGRDREDNRDRDRRDRNRGLRSGERSRRSRSRSRSDSQRRRSRSNSRSRNRKRHMRSRSRERKEDKEREKERQRKGLPSMKREHLSICSTTLWVGHLSKLVSQEELSDTFGVYGDVVSIDLIASRGCAFVVMNRRQDACRALDRLKNFKLQSKAITLAWAPGKGVKGRDWKDYWEVDAGVSYIPWSKLKVDTALDEFEDGGSIDEDTLPDFLKQQYKAITSKEDKKDEKEKSSGDIKEDVNSVTMNHSNSATNIPSLLTLTSDNVSTGDTDSRPPLDVAAAAAAQAPAVTQVGQPSLVSPYGMSAAMMNVPSMAMNMMIPPPMMGNPMCLPPQFQGLNALPNMAMPMMGMIPANMSGMPQDPSTMKLNAGQGLLGEMPMPSQPSINLQTAATNVQEFVDRMNDENRKRRPDDRRENREKKRSRFEDADDRISPSRDVMEMHSPSNFDRLKDGAPPLFERLKNMAGGYGFGGPGNEKMNMPNSLLGAPIGPPQQGMGIRGNMDPRMSDPRGFPTPLLPRGGHPGQFNSPRGPPFPGDRHSGPGPRPWFDGPQNPFIHQNSQNPFTGNPYIQKGGPNQNDNPFDMGGPPRGGGGDRGGRGQFFGGPEPPNHFGPRGAIGGRGWPRGEGPSPPNNWRGGPPGQRGGRGAGPGSGPGRGPSNWRGRSQEEDIGPRDLDRDRDNGRGFRGGRGRDWDSRERGNDFDRGSDRRRDWDRSGRDRNDRDRDPPGRGRDRDRENRDHDFRDRGYDKEKDSSNNRGNRKRSVDESTPRSESRKVESIDENWEEGKNRIHSMDKDKDYSSKVKSEGELINRRNSLDKNSSRHESEKFGSRSRNWGSNDEDNHRRRSFGSDSKRFSPSGQTERPTWSEEQGEENWESHSMPDAIKTSDPDSLPTENNVTPTDGPSEEKIAVQNFESDTRQKSFSSENNDGREDAALENDCSAQELTHHEVPDNYSSEVDSIKQEFPPDRRWEEKGKGALKYFEEDIRQPSLNEQEMSGEINKFEAEEPRNEEMPLPQRKFSLPLMDNCIDENNLKDEPEIQKLCVEQESVFEQNNFNSSENVNDLGKNGSENTEVTADDN